MAIIVPLDFNIFAQDLDRNETFIRDKLKLNIVNWAKFRHTINIGNDPSNLRPLVGVISPKTKEAYKELAKSHYEAILSLGYAKLSLEIARKTMKVNILLCQKSCKDFYFHLGCLLDNLARLIYIINDPQSSHANYNKGQRKGKLIRHWIDWGELNDYKGYKRLKRSIHLRGIINIRNVFTHGWSCPIYLDEETGTFYWPIAIRTRREFYWPQVEITAMRRHYRKQIPILGMMQSDLQFIETFQNQVFSKLTRDVRKFEKNNGVEIH